MTKKETLSERLTKVMDLKRLSRAEVARLSGIDPSYVSQILKGQIRRSLGLDVICNLARAVGEDPKEIFRLAAGLPPEGDTRRDATASELVALMTEIIADPGLLDTLRDLSALPRKRRIIVLPAIRKMINADNQPARGSQTS